MKKFNIHYSYIPHDDHKKVKEIYNITKEKLVDAVNHFANHHPSTFEIHLVEEMKGESE